VNVPTARSSELSPCLVINTLFSHCFKELGKS
jgi:hypothetical protein